MYRKIFSEFLNPLLKTFTFFACSGTQSRLSPLLLSRNILRRKPNLFFKKICRFTRMSFLYTYPR